MHCWKRTDDAALGQASGRPSRAAALLLCALTACAGDDAPQGGTADPPAHQAAAPNLEAPTLSEPAASRVPPVPDVPAAAPPTAAADSVATDPHVAGSSTQASPTVTTGPAAPHAVGTLGAAPNAADTEPAPAELLPFIVHNNAPTSLLSRVFADSLRICLSTPGVDDAGREARQVQIITAVNKWLAEIVPVSSRPIQPSIVFDCAGTPDLTIKWSSAKRTPTRCDFTAEDPDGNADTFCKWEHVTRDLKTMFLYADTAGFHVLLHELGHAFGLADTYVVGGACQPGQPSSLLCDQTELLEDDRLGIRQAFCELFPAQCVLRSEVTGWCPSSRGYVQTGDFNADGRADLLCHEFLSGYQRVLLATDGGFVDGALQGYGNTTTPFCAGTTSTLVLGNLNGDTRADLICHDMATGTIETAFTREGVRFATVSGRHPVAWCAGNRYLQVGDFNGDQRADLFCRRVGATGTELLINLASSAGAFGAGFAPQGGWCTDMSMATALADLNRDGSGDVYCRNPAGPTVALGTGTGQLGSVLGFTYFVWQTGDVNGDGHVDLVVAWPAYTGVIYGNGGLYPGVSRFWASTFCKTPGDILYLADVSRDGADDYVCHHSSSGAVSVLRQPSAKAAMALAAAGR